MRHATSAVATICGTSVALTLAFISRARSPTRHAHSAPRLPDAAQCRPRRVFLGCARARARSCACRAREGCPLWAAPSCRVCYDATPSINPPTSHVDSRVRRWPVFGHRDIFFRQWEVIRSRRRRCAAPCNAESGTCPSRAPSLRGGRTHWCWWNARGRRPGGLLVFYSNIPKGVDCDKVAVDDSRVEKWTTSPPHAVIDALDRF